MLEALQRWIANHNKKTHISSARRRYRLAYVEYMRRFDEMDCGHSLAQRLFSDMRSLATQFDAAANDLIALGLTPPEFRLTTA